MTEKLPWNRKDFFLDEVDEYPMYDYFPLLTTDISQEEITSEQEVAGVY